MKSIKTRIAMVREKGTKSYKDNKQCIIFPNGTVFCGYDAWRLLNRIDDISYPLEKYPTVDAMLSKYEVIKNNHGYYREEGVKHGLYN